MDRPVDTARSSNDLRDLYLLAPVSRSAHTRERRAAIIGGIATIPERRALWFSLAVHVCAALLVALILHGDENVIVVPADFRITLEGRVVSPSPPAARQELPRPEPPEPARAAPAVKTPAAAAKPDPKGAIVPRPARPAPREAGGPPGASHAALSAPEAGRRSATLAPNEIRVGSGGGVTGSFPFAYYLNGVRAAIQRHWTPPRGAAASGPLDATVRFTIARDGSVTDLSIEERSGVSSFDQAAAAAVRRAVPLAPLPRAYEHDDLVVHLGFHYAE